MLNAPAFEVWIEIELTEQEVVGVDDADVVGVNGGPWEVAQVERHQHLDVGADGGGQDVPILPVAGHDLSQGRVLLDLRVREVPTHLLDPMSSLVRIETCAIHQIALELVQHIVGPQRPKGAASARRRM